MSLVPIVRQIGCHKQFHVPIISVSTNSPQSSKLWNCFKQQLIPTVQQKWHLKVSKFCNCQKFNTGTVVMRHPALLTAHFVFAHIRHLLQLSASAGYNIPVAPLQPHSSYCNCLKQHHIPTVRQKWQLYKSTFWGICITRNCSWNLSW